MLIGQNSSFVARFTYLERIFFPATNFFAFRLKFFFKNPLFAVSFKTCGFERFAPLQSGLGLASYIFVNFWLKLEIRPNKRIFLFTRGLRHYTCKLPTKFPSLEKKLFSKQKNSITNTGGLVTDKPPCLLKIFFLSKKPFTPQFWQTSTTVFF